MDAQMQGRSKPSDGYMELIEIPSAQWAPSPANQLHERKVMCRWHPPVEITHLLPSWYDLCLCCDAARDGSQRFTPLGADLAGIDSPSQGMRYVSTTEGLLAVAAVGGRAILASREEQPVESPLGFEAARLLQQYVKHMREHFGDTIRLHNVLGICSGARTDSGTQHILPPDLGLDGRGEGDPWGPAELKQEGLREARSRHIPNPDAEEILRLGLLAAAKRRSLAIEDERAEQLIRMTLFDLSPSDKPVDEVGLAYVANHVKASLNDHLNDTTERFDLWITDPKSNLLRRIAKRQDCSLTREEVRAALLQLGWESLKITARCIDAQMQAFRDALPNPLPPADRSLFDQIYVGQTCWGGFPLLLLHNRFPLLREAILELWQAPFDQSRTAALHSMMYFYGSMLNSRRESDRHYKRAGKLIIGDGKLPYFEPVPEAKNRDETDDCGDNAGSRGGAELADPASAEKYAEQEYFRDAAIHIANMRGLLPFPIPWHLQAEVKDPDGEQITIRVFSEQPHVDVVFNTTAEEFRAEVEALF